MPLVTSTASFALCDNVTKKDEIDIDTLFNGFEFHYNKYGTLSRQYTFQFLLTGNTIEEVEAQQKELVSRINKQNRLRYILGFDLENTLTFSTYSGKYSYEHYRIDPT